MMTTKEQERAALAKIRKIVDSLGEDSYVATAFEGCFEDAEENIELDMACSWKQRAASWEDNCQRLEKLLDEARKEREELNGIIHALNDKIHTMNCKILAPEDADAVTAIIRKVICEAQKDEADAAAKIIAHAEIPSSDAFQTAVAAHRDAKARIDRCNDLLKSLSAY